MENSNTNKAAEGGVEYWLQWQVLVCALIFILPTAAAIRILRKRGGGGGRDLVDPADLWATCWRNLHPRWLLIYRASAFAGMAFFLYQTVAAFGFFVFFFYTQWPYPFLDLSTPWAPLWYLALALVHIPCYGLYVLLTKAKHAVLSRMYPQNFVRASTEKKQI